MTTSSVVQPSTGQGMSKEDGKKQVSTSKVVPFTRKSISPEQGWEDRHSPQTLWWLVSFQYLIGALCCRLRGISSIRADTDFAEVMQTIECELLSFVRGFDGLESKPEDGEPGWDLRTRIAFNIRIVPPVSDAAYEMLRRFEDLLRMREEELARERDLQTLADSKEEEEEKVSLWKVECRYKEQTLATFEIRDTEERALDAACNEFNDDIHYYCDEIADESMTGLGLGETGVIFGTRKKGVSR